MQENRYMRKDCEKGFLTDPDEIAYYKATQREDIICNCMLGDFNDNGEYIIQQNIVDELIAMPKQVINSFSNMTFCQSLVVTEYIEQEKFVVKTSVSETHPNIKTSVLEVMENVSKVQGCIINTVSTAIAEFTDIDSPMYQTKMYEAFNIVDASEYTQQELSKFSHGYVNLRRKYLSSIKQLTNVQLQDAAKQAYFKKLEILKQSGKVAEPAIKLFEARLQQNPIIASQNDYKALNELLDSVIETHKETLQPIMPKIHEVGVIYSEQVKTAEKHANLNLQNMQKSDSAIKAIQTQQDNIQKNILTEKPIVKKVITDQAKNVIQPVKQEQKQGAQETATPKKEQPQKTSILKTILGTILPNEQKINKENAQKAKQDAKQPSAQEKAENKTEKSSSNKKAEQAQPIKQNAEKSQKTPEKDAVKPSAKTKATPVQENKSDKQQTDKPAAQEKTNTNENNNRTIYSEVASPAYKPPKQKQNITKVDHLNINTTEKGNIKPTSNVVLQPIETEKTENKTIKAEKTPHTSEAQVDKKPEVKTTAEKVEGLSAEEQRKQRLTALMEKFQSDATKEAHETLDTLDGISETNSGKLKILEAMNENETDSTVKASESIKKVTDLNSTNKRTKGDIENEM